MKRSIPFYLILLLSISLVLSSCFVVPKEPEKIDFPEISAGEVTYHVDELKRQDLRNSISIYGTLQPELREGLFFRYSGGRLLDVFVEEDQQVVEGQVLATLNVSGLSNQIRLLEIELEKAQIRRELRQLSGTTRFELRLTELDVQSAEIRLADAKEKLSNNSIVAPFDGMVTYVSAEVGDYVEPFNPIISLENLDNLILECDPRSSQHLNKNMVVDVEVERNTYRGVVVRSYRDLVTLGLEALEKEKVQIQVYDLPADIERNTSARITVIIAEVKDTIVIQKSHVKYFGDRTFVYLLRDGIKVEQDVLLGLETRSKVEILEGLAEGDQIIVK